MVGVSDGGQSSVSIGHIDRVGGSGQIDGAGMGHGHSLRGFGAEHHGRVTVKDPSLVGAYCRDFRGAVMVEDAQDSVDGSAAPSVLDVIVVTLHENIDALVLCPHWRNPRLANVGHQGTDSTRRRQVGAAVSGVHPSLGEAVVALADSIVAAIRG